MKKKVTTFDQLKIFALPHKKYYVFSIIFAITGVIMSILPYYVVSQIMMNVIEKNKSMDVYFQSVLLLILLWLARVLSHIISTTLSHKATFRVLKEIRLSLTKKLTKVSMGYLVSTPSGELKNMMIEKIDSIEPTLAHVVPEMTANLLGPLLTITYLFYLDWRIALASLLTLPFGLLSYLGMMRGYEANYKNYLEKNRRLNATAVEYIRGIEVIKAFNQSAGSYKKFVTVARQAADSAINWMKSCHVYYALAMAVFPGVLIAVLPMGGWLYMKEMMTLDMMILSIILSLGIMPPLMTAMTYTDDLAKIGAIISDISKVLYEEEMDRPKEHKVLNNCSISLKDVSFSYDSKKTILNHFSATIHEGEVTAIVGPSGGGKSTVAKLIASWWDTTSGDITIGGISTKDIPLSQINDMIAFVSQDNYLFDRSIMENIRMGNLAASDDMVVATAQKSGCHEFIMNLEQGYDTVVGSAGGHLSGGERQRVAIARAMLKDAPIIIFDEATAYTDPENEAVIQASVAQLVAGKTLIVIAHRLSTIIDADQIIVIDKGRVTDTGSHETLLSTSELYCHMWHAHISSRDEDIKEVLYDQDIQEVL